MTSLEFAEAVRCLAGATRRAGYRAPSFRSRPRGTSHRTIRRRADGSATVAVALPHRPIPAVLGDLIDGIVAANELTGTPAAELRDQLWLAVLPVLESTDMAPDMVPNGTLPDNVVPFAA